MWKRPKSRMGKIHTSMDDLNTAASSRPTSSVSSNADHAKSEFSGLVFRIDENAESVTSNDRKRLTKIRSDSPIQMRSPPTPLEKAVTIYDVAIIGAGPAGLILAANLLRFGINVLVLDNRSGGTVTGRADSLQPKTIETLRQMRLADRLLQKGVKVHDTRFWSSIPEAGTGLRRLKRDILFPPDLVDTTDPYLLNSHQGFLEQVLLEDLLERDLEVHRNITFVDYRIDETSGKAPIDVVCESDVTREKLVYKARFLVGCDGATSNVRKMMPGTRLTGSASGEIWGVIDGVLDTDFPDIYSKTVVHSREAGTIVMFPRERNMTRIYVELKPDVLGETQSQLELTQKFVMDRVAEILEPNNIRWKSVEWFGRYQISRKLASRFVDDSCRVFLAGDAAHTHSPKSQGMNTSIHDACNLAWKLNLAVRGLSKANVLVKSYEEERMQVAEDLLDYDAELIDALTGGDPQAYVENCLRNARMVSGFGADYTPSLLNVSQKGSILGSLRAGSIPPPAKVTRFFDMAPVDIQLDIPMLGQFRIYFFTRNIQQALPFLEEFSTFALDDSTVLGKATLAANLSYSIQPPFAAPSDEFVRPERYTTISGLLTFGLVLRSMDMEDIVVKSLPPLFRESQYTVYIDDVPHMDTRGMTCTEKWLGTVAGSEVDVVVIRPDGYVGTMYRGLGSKDHAKRACKHLSAYFEGFLSL